MKRKEREAGARAGREAGPPSAGWADGKSAGGKTGWAKRPPGRGQGWCFFSFFKTFSNIILNAK